MFGNPATDIWIVEVTEDGPLGLRAARELLCPDERSALPRHRQAADLARSLVAHAALRRLVAARLGTDPRRVEIERDSGGRPEVLGHPSLRVSISHSGAFVACALARQDVGVDIERCDRVEADHHLAGRVCTPRERRELGRLAPRERGAALVRLWVRKEALAKALGAGLALPFETVDVRRRTARLAGGTRQPWLIRDLEAPAGYVAAVALRGGRARSWSNLRGRCNLRAQVWTSGGAAGVSGNREAHLADVPHDSDELRAQRPGCADGPG